ncbi:MAG: ComF family protein, partial [Gemmatimonadales bacterium]|nr:ComF family protein [Gemmatimonadales bacterium]
MERAGISRALGGQWGALLRAVERFVLPNVCVACERPVERGRPDALVCTPCLSRLRSVDGGCNRCSQPLPPVGPCRFCDGWPVALAWARSAVWLDLEARQVIHHLKYDGLSTLGAEIARLIARSVPGFRNAVLVPIPLGRRRMRQRGFNQAEVVASVLARRWSVPMSPSLLRRQRETRTQTSLDPQGRRENVRDAFVARPPTGRRREAGGGGPPSTTVILVDDVL